MRLDPPFRHAGSCTLGLPRSLHGDANSAALPICHSPSSTLIRSMGRSPALHRAVSLILRQSPAPWSIIKSKASPHNANFKLELSISFTGTKKGGRSGLPPHDRVQAGLRAGYSRQHAADVALVAAQLAGDSAVGQPLSLQPRDLIQLQAHGWLAALVLARRLRSRDPSRCRSSIIRRSNWATAPSRRANLSTQC